MQETALSIQNIQKSFGELKAVNNVSFHVYSGECFGILGPNGAGKTTTMKMIYSRAVMDRDSPGAISVFGYNPLKDDREIKFLSGIVPQEDNLDIELSVAMNLKIYANFYGIPRKDANKRIDELLEFMELTDKKNVKIKQLSGGMKRRLTIARSLLNNPRLLILDEPTTGLDPQVRHIIWDKLRILKNNGVTILLTTHYMDEAFQICDRLMLMDNGKKILEGKPALLIKDNIENYVLEIINKTGLPANTPSQGIRKEETSNRLIFYSDDLKKLETITEKLFHGDFYLRNSNLEDLFLKMTGRQLNEQQ